MSEVHGASTHVAAATALTLPRSLLASLCSHAATTNAYSSDRSARCSRSSPKCPPACRGSSRAGAAAVPELETLLTRPLCPPASPAVRCRPAASCCLPADSAATHLAGPQAGTRPSSAAVVTSTAGCSGTLSRAAWYGHTAAICGLHPDQLRSAGRDNKAQRDAYNIAPNATIS